MKVKFSGVLVLSFLLSQACTSVKVEVEYAQGPASLQRPFKPPIDPAQLPKLDPNTGDQIIIGIPRSCPAASVSQNVKIIPQETDAWCWAASAQTIMEAHQFSIRQCDIVDRVYLDELTTNCCGNGTTFPGECWRNGWPDEAFNNFEFNWDYVEGPLQEDDAAGQLCENGPFIFVLLFEGGGGHTFVVKDLEYIKNSNTNAVELFLWVYDHKSPADFELWSYDAFVEGMWKTGRFIHGLDYVQLSPIE